MDGNKVLDMNKEEALELLKQMWAIRWFEDQVSDLLGQNKIKGASHLYAGEEAVAVGAVAALRDDDLITSTHRGHGIATPGVLWRQGMRKNTRSTTTRCLPSSAAHDRILRGAWWVNAYR